MVPRSSGLPWKLTLPQTCSRGRPSSAGAEQPVRVGNVRANTGARSIAPAPHCEQTFRYDAAFGRLVDAGAENGIEPYLILGKSKLIAREISKGLLSLREDLSPHASGRSRPS